MKRQNFPSILILSFFTVLLFSNYTISAKSNSKIDQSGEIVVIENGGTGPYSAIVTEDAGLPGMTIYRPKDLTPFAGKKLPVLLWGNGACANSTDEHKNFLNEIASHGYIVLGIGPLKRVQGGTPGGGGMGGTKASQLTDALDWITKQNNSSGNDYSGKIDISKVAAMGMSCGGLQAIQISGDPRISTTVVCNSGILPEPSTMAAMPSLTKDDLLKYHNPVIYIMGGPTDIAYNNAMDDFSRVKHVPIVITNFDVGHGGTYRQPHGGAFTKVALAWLNWQLKGIKDDSKEFLGDDCGLCKDPEWKIETKNF